MKYFLLVSFLAWMPIVLSLKQNTQLIVLSPTDNQQYTLGGTILFDYVPIDDSLEQLNIYLDYFGTRINEIEVKLVADISNNPNGTYKSTDGQTYKKYSLAYTIPTDLPIEGESYEANFQTAVGNVLVPIIIKGSVSATSSVSTTISTSSLTSTVSATSADSNLPSTALATTSSILSTALAATNTISTAIPSSATSSLSSSALATAASILSTASSASSSAISTAVGSTTSSVSDATASPAATSSSMISSAYPSNSPSAMPSDNSSTQTIMSASGFPSPSLIASTTPTPPDIGTFLHHSNANSLKTNSLFVTLLLGSIMVLI